jgi:regulator of protease activity HflC (stomatin/prohibitin superfamily)
MDEATFKWGVKVNRVEIKNITPPREIQLAMEKQMQAERERRAQVLTAEGDKQARIAISEGMRQEQINMAEGHKEAEIRKAEGQAEAIMNVAKAQTEALTSINRVMGDPELTAKYLIATDYLVSFTKFVQGKADKIFVPYEASTALAGLGSIKELLASGASIKPESKKNS